MHLFARVGSASPRPVVILSLFLLLSAGLLLRPAPPSAAHDHAPPGLSAADWSSIQDLLPPVQQDYLKASNTDAGDEFSASVAVDGDTVVVGAPFEDSSSTGVNGDQRPNDAAYAGAVYVFVRAGTAWVQQAYLKASNTNADDIFGASVAVDGDTMIVGAPGEDSAATGINGVQTDNSAPNAGAAYVFVRSNGIWVQQAYLKASNPDAYDAFGMSVAVDGVTVVVATIYEDSAAAGINGVQTDNSAPESGAAYVFVRSNDIWAQQAYLKASNPNADDWFGGSVAVDGDTMVVGASFEDSAAAGINGVQTDNSAPNAGAAYVFVRSNDIWVQQAYLKASNPDANDWFSWSVAVDGDMVVIGAFREASAATGVNGDQTDNSAEYAGAAYVFVRSNGIWTQQAYLKASNTDAYDAFGWSVAVDGVTVVVAAVYEDSSATGVNGDQSDNSVFNAGAAYVFVRSNGIWTQHAYLKASDSGGAGDGFGYLVAVDAVTVVVGVYYEDSAATGINGNTADNSAPESGAAYVFVGLEPTSTPIPTATATGTSIPPATMTATMHPTGTPVATATIPMAPPRHRYLPLIIVEAGTTTTVPDQASRGHAVIRVAGR